MDDGRCFDRVALLRRPNYRNEPQLALPRCLGFLVACLFALNVHAQPYSIDLKGSEMTIGIFLILQSVDHVQI
jgi:hypothetical protein